MNPGNNRPDNDNVESGLLPRDARELLAAAARCKNSKALDITLRLIRKKYPQHFQPEEQ